MIDDVVVVEQLEGMKKEIERLNNIINELEKWVKERIDNVKYNDYDDMLDKLKELKDSDKE